MSLLHESQGTVENCSYAFFQSSSYTNCYYSSCMENIFGIEAIPIRHIIQKVNYLNAAIHYRDLGFRHIRNTSNDKGYFLLFLLLFHPHRDTQGCMHTQRKTLVFLKSLDKFLLQSLSTQKN